MAFPVERLVAPVAILLALPLAAVATPPTFTATELVSPGDGYPLLPVTINDLHNIAAMKSLPDGSTLGVIVKKHSFETFRAFPGGKATEVMGMNSDGDVVGVASNPAEMPKQLRGYIRRNGVTTELFPVNDPGIVEVNGLSATAVVGSWRAGEHAPKYAFKWEAGTITWLKNVPGDPGKASWEATDITNDGRWVGNGAHAHGSFHPFALEPDGTLVEMDTHRDQGAVVHRGKRLFGGDSEMMVGDTSRDGSTRVGAVYTDYRLDHLASLGGSQASLLDLNTGGHAVGWALNGDGHMRALYWDSGDDGQGASYDLNDYVSLPGISLTAAVSINGWGEVLATGNDSSGLFHGYLLRPN